MQKRNTAYFVAGLTIIALSVGVTILQLFSPIGARSSDNPIPQPPQVVDNKPVAWQRVEIPIDSSLRSLTVDVNSVASSKDWMMGVKIVDSKDKERMYAGIVTWEVQEKAPGFLKVTKIENYPHEHLSIREGKFQFGDLLSNQALVVYVEKRAATRLFLEQKGERQDLAASDESFIVFNGDRSNLRMEGPSSILNELHIRKQRAYLERLGADVRLNSEGK